MPEKDILKTLLNRFDQLDERFDQIDHSFEQVDRRFDKLDNVLTEHDLKLHNLQKTLDRHSREFDDLNYTVKMVHNQTVCLSLEQSKLSLKMNDIRDLETN